MERDFGGQLGRRRRKLDFPSLIHHSASLFFDISGGKEAEGDHLLSTQGLTLNEEKKRLLNRTELKQLA